MFTKAMTVSTARLLLRPWLEADAGELWEIVPGDAEIQRWMLWARDYSREAAICWTTQHAHAPGTTNFAIVPRDIGRARGGIGLRDMTSGGRVPTAEIGYWLAERQRGQGYVCEAVLALCAQAFKRGVERIELLAATENAASRAVAERAGFVREGVLRRAGTHPEGAVDLVVYGLLKGELEGVHQ